MGRTSDAKQNLIESAAALLAGRGYTAVGVNELCEQAGIKKGSFYHFFASKQDLTLEALDQAWAQARETVVEPAFRNDIPPLARIQRIFDLFAAAQSKIRSKTGHMTGCPFGNMALEMSTQDEHIRRKVQRILKEWTGYFEDALREAAEAGELPGRNPPEAARAVTAYLQGAILMAKAQNRPALIRELGRHVKDFLRHQK